MKKRFTYQHQNQQYTLFYLLPDWRSSNWAIGPTNAYAAGTYNAKVNSVVLCPEQITETEWSEYIQSQFYPSYIQIQCPGGAASEAAEFEPDSDISGLNDTESSLTFDILPNEDGLKMTFVIIPI